MSEQTILTEPGRPDAPAPGEADALQLAIEKMRSRTPEQILADRERLYLSVRRGRALPEGKTLLDMVEGTWPGDETDEEIRDALERLS